MAGGRLSRVAYRLAGLAVLLLLVAAVVGVAVRDVAGPLANHVLANALGSQVRSMPPTVTDYSAGSDGVEIVGGKGEGLSCSLPPLAEWLAFPRDARTASVSLQMRQACVHHDLCYRHGAATYGYSQVDCDYLLQENAFKLCTQINGPTLVKPASAKQAAEPELASVAVRRHPLRPDDVLPPEPTTKMTGCETDARKIALGVILGGAGSFRRADSTPGDALPTCTYCRYFAFWNAWKKEYWAPPPPAWDAQSSTYYEFDGQPQRSREFATVRIADRPRNWTNAMPKALYVFRTRPSGLQLRILGVGMDGKRLCAAYTLGGDFRFRSSLPVVTRMAQTAGGPAEDWLVWMRQNETEQPETAFSGLAPGRATSADWMRLFGSGRDITDSALCAGDKRSLDAAASLTSASFVDIHAMTGGVARLVGLNAIYPDAANGTGPAGAMVFFGLSDKQCAADDRSSCIVKLTISPEKDIAAVNREPFRTFEKNCSLSAGAGSCDLYRDFVLPPQVVRSDLPAGLVWSRRGAPNGDGYSSNAVFRWTPAETPPGLAPFYEQVDAQRLRESYEPMAWTAPDANNRQGLISIVPSEACGGLKVVRFSIAPKPALSVESRRMTRCLPDLDVTWLARPWRMIGGRTVLMMRVSFQEARPCDAQAPTECDEPKVWPSSSLQVVEFNIDDASNPGDWSEGADTTKAIRAKPSSPVHLQYFCLVNYENPRGHYAQSDGCSSGDVDGKAQQRSQTLEWSTSELDGEARLRDIAGLINRAPVAVGDFDGDGDPEIAVLTLDYDDFSLFRKERGSPEWRRVDPPA